MQALFRFEHAPEACVDDVELVLPTQAAIVGRVLAPPYASLEGLRVLADAVGDVPPDDWTEDFDAFLEAPLAPDGTYRIEPFPIRPARIGLVGRGQPGTLSSADLELDRPGDHEHDFDLLATWSGDAYVRVLVQGEPAEGLHVTFHRHVGEHWIHAARARTDVHGVAHAQPLGGSDYRIAVGRMGNWWSLSEPGAFSVLSGERVDRTVHLAAARVELLVVDAVTGEPLREAEVVLLHEDRRSPTWNTARPTRSASSRS